MFHFSLLSSFADRIEYPEGSGNKFYLYKELWTEYAKSTLAMVYFYTAIALAVILIAIGIFVKLKRGQHFASFLKTATAITMTFAVTVIITMIALGFCKIAEKGYMQDKDMLLELVPPIVLGAVTVIGAIICYIAGFFSERTRKIALTVCGSVIGAALIATIVCLAVYFSHAIADDGYYDDQAYGKLNQTGLYTSAAVLIVAAVVAAILLDRKNKQPFNSRCIALAGICIAVSFALSYIKFFEMPQGGSITLASLLPVLLFAYIYGPRKGIFVGCIYGMLQAIQDPYIIHPAQFLLDYPIAFAMVGFAGAFKNVKGLDRIPQIKFVLGAIIAGALRFFAHVLSGVFAFGAYALDSGETNFWLYSTAYNSFVFVDLVLVVIAGVLAFSSKGFNKRIAAFANAKTKITEEQPAEQSQ